MKRTSSDLFLLVVTVLLFGGTTPVAAQNDNPTGKAGVFNGNSNTAGSYDPYTANATRTVVDISVPGAVGAYGLQWTRTTNSRRMEGANYDFGDGGSWQHSYGWGIETVTISGIGDTIVLGSNSPQPTSYIVYYPDGRVVEFQRQASSPPDPMYRGPSGVADRFQPVARSGLCYLLLSDGGKVEFQQNGYLSDREWSFDIIPTAMVDPYGQRTTLTYGGPGGQLSQVTEPAGRWLRINYSPIASHSLITSVQAGYGDNTVTQSVTYSYQAFNAGGFTYNTLTGASYSDGTSAAYTYQSSNTYPNTGPPLIQTCNDVRYPGPMKKIAYEFAAQPNETYGGIYGEFAIARPGLYPAPQAVSYWLGGHTETRGDGPQRTFVYGTNLNRPQYVVPQPYLLSQYSDFKWNATYLGYDANTYVNTIEDANSSTTTFTRTFTGKIASLTHPPDVQGATSTVTYAYTDPTYGYYLQSVTDELQHTTVYQRDANNRVKEIDYPDGASETFSFNNLGEVSSHKMTSGGIETFDYDGRGLKQSYRDAYHQFYGENPTSRYQYDSLDRLSGVTDARGVGTGDPNYTTHYEYNQRGQLTNITHPTDAATAAPYTVINNYNDDGTLRDTADERGNATSFGYDDYKRLTSVTAPPAFAGDGAPRTTSYYYDHTGGTAADYTHTDNNVWRLMTPLGKTVQTAYDENFWKNAVVAGTGAEAAKTSYSYDAVGNVKTVTEPANQAFGSHTEYFYDKRNRLTDINDASWMDRNTLGHTISWTYDQAGNKKTQLRANNQLVAFDQYDAMNRLQAQSVQRDVNVVDHTAMTYDFAGNLATFVDGRQKVYSYGYDFLNRRTSATYPADDNGVATTESYHYDLSNLLDRYTNRAGAVQTFTYDNRNRQTYFWWSDGTRSRWTNYDPVSNVTRVRNSGEDTVDFVYDFRNRKTSETQMSGGIRNPWTVSYTYDADSSRKTITYPSGAVYTYNYTSRNEVANEADANSAIVSYTYDLSGNRLTRSLRNGTSSQYYPDALNRPEAIRLFRSGAQFGRFDYGYNVVSQITSAQRDGERGDAFGYYLDGQLNTAKFDAVYPQGGGGDPVNTTVLAYDGNGNRTSQTNTAGQSYNYTVNDLNQYNSVSYAPVPRYDANGDLTSYNWTDYSYDAQNRLVTANNGSNSLTFWSDALGRQILRKVNGQWIYSIWDGWNLIEERNEQNTLLHTYLHGSGSDEMVQRSGGGATIWYYQDAQGSTTHLADDAGNLIESYKYPPADSGAPAVYNWLGQQISSSAYDNRFLYTGRDWLKEVALYDYRNRFYNPGLGRFLQPDPIGFAGDPSNLYRYCGNNPVNWSDPSGLFSLSGLWNSIVKIFTEGRDSGSQNSSSSSSSSSSSNSSSGGDSVTYYGAPPTGSNIPQTRTATPNGSLWNVSYHDTINGTQEAGSFALVSGGGFGDTPRFVPAVEITRSGTLQVDDDGTGPDHGDPHHDPNTSYRRNGTSLNADVDPYVAIPTILLSQGVRLGDNAVLIVNGNSAPGVVGDAGANPRLVEASVALVHNVGVPTVDRPGGPVPNTRGGRDLDATMIIFLGGR